MFFSYFACLHSFIQTKRDTSCVNLWQIWDLRASIELDLAVRAVRGGKTLCISRFMTSCQPPRNDSVAVVRLFALPRQPRAAWLTGYGPVLLPFFPSLCRLARLQPVHPVFQQQHHFLLSVSALYVLQASLSHYHQCITILFKKLDIKLWASWFGNTLRLLLRLKSTTNSFHY